MAWETALDRLLMQQIHLAEKGEARSDTVKQQVLDLWEMDGTRSASAFLVGYARILLGADLPEVDNDASCRRWYVFGRVRAHDRRGERNWVAEILQDTETLVDLLSDPGIAGQCLPLVMRTLFWSGDLKLAVRALEYLAGEAETSELELMVDAAISDLLVRLENRVDREDQESTANILGKVLGMSGFERLPADVRSRYHKALAQRLLAGSEFQGAMEQLDRARELASSQPRLRSSIDALAALAEMRLHTVIELEPRQTRPEREAALAWLRHVEEDPDEAVPDALFIRSILAYETGSYVVAARGMEKAIAGMRRLEGRDVDLMDRARFFQAAALLAGRDSSESSRALRLMDQALETVRPDLESFYAVHEAVKELDRKLALRFLDAVDIGRGTSPDQLLFVALEYLALGEAEPAERAAQRVLQVAVDLDQRIEAMRVLLTARNMRGDREGARATFDAIRDLLMQRGAFQDLENLLKNEEFVGQALDHLEIKCELANLYEEMEGREFERANLQMAIARSLRARKDVESLRQAHALLEEASISFPELARDDLDQLAKLLALSDTEPLDPGSGESLCKAAASELGHEPRILVVGGNERQRRHHPRFEKLAEEWGFHGEWLMANYTSPQKLVNAVADRIGDGIDLLVLLHWNRHETTEPALDLARKSNVLARTVHYAGFTSLQTALSDLLTKLGPSTEPSSA